MAWNRMVDDENRMTQDFQDINQFNTAIQARQNEIKTLNYEVINLYFELNGANAVDIQTNSTDNSIVN